VSTKQYAVHLQLSKPVIAQDIWASWMKSVEAIVAEGDIRFDLRNEAFLLRRKCLSSADFW
jgi:hypothetical protein